MTTATLEPTAIKEHPILFSGAMVKAILEGRKTQTRRVIKMPPFDSSDAGLGVYAMVNADKCPYGKPGDRLWVRETWRPALSDTHDCYAYKADWRYRCGKAIPEPEAHNSCYSNWKPSIHMPRAVSRLTLEVADVRVQRLQDISEEDAIAEGVRRIGDGSGVFEAGPNFYTVDYAHGSFNAPTAKECFAFLWDSINAAKCPWDINPWVWAVSFQKLEA